jgi:hypothetical protein
MFVLTTTVIMFFHPMPKTRVLEMVVGITVPVLEA